MQERLNGAQPDAMVDISPADWATADEIRRRRFSVVDDGYSPDEVHDYLGHLAGTFATLRSQIGDLRRTVPAASGPEGMSDLASKMAGVLREAEDHAANLRQDAEQESGRLVADARQEADRVLNEARQEADRTVHAARRDAEKSVAGHVEAARKSAAEADKAVAEATAQAAMLLTTAHEEAARVRAGAQEEASAARADADRRVAEALEFRDMVLLELRGAVERIAAAAPGFPTDDAPRPGEGARPTAAGAGSSAPADEAEAGSGEDAPADLLS